MSTTTMYRPQTVIVPVTISNVAADQNNTIDLPSGLYQVSIVTNQNLAVGTANIECRAFVNEAQTKVSQVFGIQDSDNSAIDAAILVGSDTGQYFRVLPHQNAAGSPTFPIPYGLRITYDVTGAMTGTISYVVVATRIA